jgi:sulfatase maturation enzyme AslB (radical SAM superfamily)
MPNQNIFCNSPWYELQIYWDGSFGICCQEAHKLYALDQQQYNIATMTIAEWFNSDPVKKFRLRMLGDQTLTECKRCGHDEMLGGNSRRLKCNQKSVIFTRQAFDKSYNQSPGFKHFRHSLEHNGQTLTMPIDMHIDLGNYCNLACKMCKSSASSTFALQEVKWGIKSSQQYIGSDWTRDSRVWEEFKQQLLEIPKLNNIHFMGGETLLTDKFEDLVDTFVAHKKFDVCFSFVTNGTSFNTKLLDKLKNFRRVGIEVSVETIDEHNAYQRQGTNTAQVLENIQRYKQYCNGTSITLALRPAPSILSIGYIVPLLEYALDNQFIIKYNLCYSPKFMNAIYLPQNIKQMYKEKYLPLLDRLSNVNVNFDYNASDLNNYPMVVKEIANVLIGLLNSETPDDSELQLEALVRHCEKWDRVYGYDARLLYPEWQEFLTRYNYDPTPSSVINFS